MRLRSGAQLGCDLRTSTGAVAHDGKEVDDQVEANQYSYAGGDAYDCPHDHETYEVEHRHCERGHKPELDAGN